MDLTSPDEGPALHVPGAGEQVHVTEALADLDGAEGGRMRRVNTALAKLLLRDRQQQVPLLHAVAAVEESPASPEPTGRLTQLAAQEKPQT